MSDVALGLDLGTSGVRVVAVDGHGQLCAETTAQYPLHTPQPGWTEQQPQDWYEASLSALQAMQQQLETAGQQAVALGMSGQMHGMTPLDAHGEVVRPAILWNDQRTAEAVAHIEQQVPRADLIARSGNPAITGFQLSKVVWMQQQEPDNFARTRHVLFPKDYLSYRLCGAMVAEPADASGSNCFNLAAKRWDEDILGALAITPNLYPQVVASDSVIGHLQASVAAHTGLPEGLPIIAGAGDNAAAALGLGISSANPARGSLSLGTSGVIFVPLEQATPDPQGRVHLFCHADGGYHLLAVTLSAAGSLQWYRDTFAANLSFGTLTRLAQESEIGSRGVSFKPYLAGERSPYMNPDLRASWTGLSLANKSCDVIRALLEGVAFSLRDAFDVTLPLAKPQELITTGGGTTSTFWLQMVCDVLGLPLLQPRYTQGVAYGAALLAMQGTGMADALETANKALQIADTLTADAHADYQAALARYRAVPVLR